MPEKADAYAFETMVWIEEGDRLVVKCGFKAHLLATAADYAALYAKSVVSDSGYITISDLLNKRELKRIPLGKAQAATA